MAKLTTSYASNCTKIICITLNLLGAWDSVVVKALPGRSRDRSSVVSLGIFSFRKYHVPWGKLSLWKWVPGISSGIMVASVFGWRPTTHVVPKVEKIQGLNLPGTPWANSACRGTLLLYFTVNVLRYFTDIVAACSLAVGKSKTLWIRLMGNSHDSYILEASMMLLHGCLEPALLRRHHTTSTT